MVHPCSLLATHAATLFGQLADVLDSGSPDAVHDARVSTRRIRELLPLVSPRQTKSDSELRDRFRRAGRALGSVRDDDVHLALVSSLQSSLPTSAEALGLVQQRYEEERPARVRKLIKTLEELELKPTAKHLAVRRGPNRVLAWLPARESWQARLRSIVVARCHGAADAIVHATGVYFPNRVHSARISVKRLRYALEAYQDTGLGDRVNDLRRLRKAQDLLGELRDRQTLLDAIAGIDVPQERPDLKAQLEVVTGFLRAESRGLHERYVAKRAVLLDICQREAMQALRRPRRRALSLGAVAASIGLTGGLVAARLHAAASNSSSRAQRAPDEVGSVSPNPEAITCHSHKTRSRRSVST
jgi:CHAD domain-containing protein